MPAPATIGQLRTRIQDMQNWDYIPCNYQAYSGNTGLFSKLGGPAGAEIPVTGSATPDGTFYFVKVDKGLLIADRVIQYGISWDKLNTSRFIQGAPWGEIPPMSSYTTPFGVVSSSSELNSNYQAWRAFEPSDGTYDIWYSSGAPSVTNPQWIAYDFQKPKRIVKFSIVGPIGYINASPKDFSLQGWDGSQWITIQEYTGVTGWVNSSGEKKDFYVSNPQFFSKYRLLITANNGNTSYVGIGYIQMYEIIGVVRSLTGGISYADANGNRSDSDQGYGGWPTNNEWDRYVVNFPVDKIQPGKTIDDVFHWNIDTGTWCQDTHFSMNTARTVRGRYVYSGTVYGNLKYLAGSSSSQSGMTWGFRPVLEYKEV
jgi:F5/8 type C domain